MTNPYEINDIDFHVNDVGTNFVITVTKDDVPQDISGALEEKVLFGKPNNIPIVRTARLLTDGKDGKILYSTVDNDLDQAGTWRVQAWISFANGSWYTGIASFVVGKNITQVITP